MFPSAHFIQIDQSIYATGSGLGDLVTLTLTIGSQLLTLPTALPVLDPISLRNRSVSSQPSVSDSDNPAHRGRHRGPHWVIRRNSC